MTRDGLGHSAGCSFRKFRWRTVLLAASVGATLVGCYADGNAHFLAEGDTRWYLTMAGCEREATARYASGGPVYGGFECRSRFAGFIVETRGYADGARIR